MTRHLVLIAILTICAAIWGPERVLASGTGDNPILVLDKANAFISTKFIAAHHASRGDVARLEGVARQEAGQGIPEKFALIETYPNYYSSLADAAHAVRSSLGFSGVLILVAPHALAISSDRLSRGEETTIAQNAWARCQPNHYVGCAVFAGEQAAQQALTDHQNAGRTSSFLWVVILAILGGLAFLIMRRARRRGAPAGSSLADLRNAAEATLAESDAAVNAIESSTQGGTTLTPQARAEYQRALGLRDTARQELAPGVAAPVLIQANDDAAQAVLGLQGVMRAAGIETPITNSLESAGHRCFYCSRTDRPPYTKRTIRDARGNEMDIEVCSADERRLEAGEQPQVQSISYGGARVPWYAVPGNPWYYAYGGPTWQYWLPLAVGMDLGSIMGGGWGMGPMGGYGGFDTFGMGAGQGIDTGSGQTMDMPPDAAEAGWGGADAGSGWDTGGWSDSGGGGWDSGGGDFSGGDSGGNWG